MDLCSQVLAEVRLVILSELARLPRGASDRVLLDVGCWDGAGTERYGLATGGPVLRGIEVFDGPAREAERRGVEVARIDLETQAFPWPDGSAHVVVCNQVFEHLKNVWLPMSEIFRVLAVGGHAVLSVPNLGSLHNRVMLALGLQPTSIRTFGPHVRGFTYREFRAFVARDAAFEIVQSRGVGFHPLGAVVARPLAGLWPGAAHTTVIVARKSRAGASPWSEYLRRELDHGLQTHFG